MTIVFPDIPLGHSIPSHRVHGWCSHCPGRSMAEELGAWQVGAMDRPATTDDTQVTRSYRLEHRRPGETTWQRNTPGVGANWSWRSREKADQRLAEARDRWPDFEHQLIETTTTVTEKPAVPAAPEERP